MHGKEKNVGDFSHWFFQAGLDILGNLSLNMQSSNLYIQNYYEYLNRVTMPKWYTLQNYEEVL